MPYHPSNYHVSDSEEQHQLSDRLHTIALITADLVGGIRKAVHTLLRGLDRDSFRILYFYSSHSMDRLAQREIEELRRRKNILLFPLHYVPKKPHWIDIVNIRRIISVARRHDCGLFHGHGAKGGIYARFAGFFSGGKTVYSPHGGVAHPQFSYIVGALYWEIERVVRRLTDIYVFESKYSQDAFVHKLSLAITEYRLVYNGIEPWSDLAPLKFEGRRIAVISVMRYEKGPDIALRTARILKDRNIYVEFVFAGDGPMLPQLRQMTQDLDLADRVSFLGDITDIRSVLDMCSLVLIPSRFESFGFVAIEALQRQRPVVAAAIGGLRETVLHDITGALVESPSPESFADAIADIVSNKYQFDFENVAVRIHREKFLQDRMVKEIEKIYYDLLRCISSAKQTTIGR